MSAGIYLFLKGQKRKSEKNGTPKITVVQIILISLVITLYAQIGFASQPWGDHVVYTSRFSSGIDISEESIGLNLIYKLLHLFTYDANVMFFVVILFSSIVLLIGYRKNEKFTPEVFLVLLLSEYFLYGFMAIKQMIANSFAVLFFDEFFKGKKIKSLIYIFLTILFHEVGYILFVIFIALSCSKNKRFRFAFYAFLIFLILFYKEIISTVLTVITSLLPKLAQQLVPYMDQVRWNKDNI